MTGSARTHADRLQIGLTLLVVVFATAAIVASSRTSALGGQALEAEHDGVVARQNLARIDSDNRLTLARQQRQLDEVIRLRALYLRTFKFVGLAEGSGDSVHGTALRQEAAEYFRQSFALEYLLAWNYLEYDSAGQLTGFDSAGFLADQRERAATVGDVAVNYDSQLSAAAGLRADTLLAGLWALGLTGVAALFTLAQAAHTRRQTWLWTAAALLAALVVVGGLGLAGLWTWLVNVGAGLP